VKKISTFILAMLFVLSAFAGCGSTFEDNTETDQFIVPDMECEPDSIPTRAQAAVMLVRFLGKEEEAIAAGGEGLAFGDLPNWTRPYVKYLYTNGLTEGTSDTSYSPDAECTAQEYITAMLMILGYGDIIRGLEYSELISFARAKDLISDEICGSKSFLGRYMEEIAEKALALPTADGRYDMLIEKLYKEGAVTKEIAENCISEAENKKIKVAFVGDSLTWSSQCTNQDENSYPALVSKWLGANYNGVNFGQGGATYMFSTIDYGYEYATNVKAFGKSLKFEPDIVIIMLGTNDASISGGKNMNILQKDATYIINKYQELESDPLVVLCSAPSCPMFGDIIKKNVNPAIKNLAKKLELDYIDTFASTTDPKLSPDNIHLNDKGYAILASVIFEQLTDILVAKGYMTEIEAKAKLEIQQADSEAIQSGIEKLPLKMNDEEELVKLFKEADIDQDKNSVKYLCPDFDCSGGIYAISSKIYNAVKKTSERNADGWIKLDPEKFYINNHPISTWKKGTPFDVHAYVKKIDDCYFIWMDNSFSFGDPGGGWPEKREASFKWNRVESEPFEFITCVPDDLGERKIQFVASDSTKTGYVYAISGDVVSEWDIDVTDTESMYGISWKKVDTYEMKVFINFYAWARGSGRQKNLHSFMKDYGVEMYVGEKDGNCYLWMKNAKNFSSDELRLNFESDAWTLYWPANGENGEEMHASTFYCITGIFRDGLKMPSDLIKFN